MEREFGEEMARRFGSRLRHIYEDGDQGLPSQIAATLEKLRRAEEGHAAASAGVAPSRSVAGDDMPRFFIMPAPSR